MQNIANKYFLEKMAKGETSQIIFGSSDKNLEGFLSRGWKIERPIEEISVNSESYPQISFTKKIVHIDKLLN